MQTRNANNQSRLILIGCLLLLLITGVLYFMKRIEANRLSTELSGTKVFSILATDKLLSSCLFIFGEEKSLP